jgi:hypothetical protein
VSLIAELKRRNVIRMAGLYLVGAWLVVQVAGTLLPVFEAPLPWFKPLQGDPRHKALIERIGAGPNAGAVR